MKVYPLKSDQKDGESATWYIPGYGPVFGAGADLWVADDCNVCKLNGCRNTSSNSFEMDAQEFVRVDGKDKDDGFLIDYPFEVKDYEVFSINIV